MPRALSTEEYSHMMGRWSGEATLEKDNEVFTPCGDARCYGCEVGSDMARGRYAKAATEDGVPTWLLPEGHRPPEADEDWRFFLEGRTDHLVGR